jgi:predicted DNA-binding transcriptional regulator AlpA
MTTTRAARDALTRKGIAPAGLPLEEAAAFIGISRNSFLKEVEAGTLPKPLPLTTRRRIWSRAALAQAIGAEGARDERAIGDEIDKAIETYAV